MRKWNVKAAAQKVLICSSKDSARSYMYKMRIVYTKLMIELEGIRLPQPQA